MQLMINYLRTGLYCKAMTTQGKKPLHQIYRRKLPQSCIAFSSPEGKTIFREALGDGNMECYFRLAAQFRTQDEPAFCGLTTLVMVLNSLEIDPGKIWKGPWRWYHENMLDCCIPIKTIAAEGINFDEFICLAVCNSLHTEQVRATKDASIEEFRKCIKKHAKMEDAFVILSYSRKVLQQTGDGHFSPLGGYHKGRDLVLVLDTARFKYPPHWIPLELLWEAMQALDDSIGKPRGYIVTSRYEGTSRLTLFRISSSFSVTLPGAYTDDIASFVSKWKEWLLCQPQNLADDAITSAVQNLAIISTALASCDTILCTQFDLNCVSEEHGCIIDNMLRDLEGTDVYKVVKAVTQDQEIDTSSLDNIGNAMTSTNTCNAHHEECRNLATEHFVSVFLYCWPYQTGRDGATHAHLLDDLLTESLKSCSEILVDELQILRRQFHVLLNMAKDKGKCVRKSDCSKMCRKKNTE